MSLGALIASCQKLGRVAQLNSVILKKDRFEIKLSAAARYSAALYPRLAGGVLSLSSGRGIYADKMWDQGSRNTGEIRKVCWMVAAASARHGKVSDNAGMKCRTSVEFPKLDAAGS